MRPQVIAKAIRQPNAGCDAIPPSAKFVDVEIRTIKCEIIFHTKNTKVYAGDVMLKDAFDFYYKATELKDLLRQGAIQWNIDKKRRESVAEHTYGCMLLAISLQAELKIDVDMEKTLEMLAIHELEELFIGDITPLNNTEKADLTSKARKHIYELVKNLNSCDRLMNLTDEFNAQLSSDAKFAKAVDKLECVLEFKKYQDLGQVSLSHLKPEMLENKKLKTFVESGKYDLADIFFLYHLPAYKDYGIDEEFWFKNLKPLKINKKNLV